MSEDIDAMLTGAISEMRRKRQNTTVLSEALAEIRELRATFSLQWDANMRGIKAWQAAHPGNDLVWPDQAKMVEWLLNEITRLRAAVPKRITSWSQAWLEGDKAPAESPIDGWNACVGAMEKAMKKEA